MTDLRKAAEMALGALERYAFTEGIAIQALRQALAHEEKPPVKSYCGGKPNYCTPEVTTEVTGNVDDVNISQERVDETEKREHKENT